MTIHVRLFACAAALAFVLTCVASFAVAPDYPRIESKVDRLFVQSSTTTPGCAVGAAVDGKTVLEKAYGMADLEHNVANMPDTIFEAGSASKQITAAAILLLARDGQLSLDDAVSKYVSEIPDYRPAPTVRDLLAHTSGLRDWGSIASIAGWPRTTRLYTDAHVLEILSRQRALNFPPSTRWSYSNSGYNLAAIIVTRVSGMPFVDFTRTRIFEPLGMVHTSWRDDHARITKNRAIAYAPAPDGFTTLMPFENTIGHAGLLTTMDDLLKWNENFVSLKVGNAPLFSQQEERGQLKDGRLYNYGLGLFVGEYRGLRDVSHPGATAGYSAMLLRLPEQRVSVVVLCNLSITASNAAGKGYEIADLLLGDRLPKPVPPALYRMSHAEMNEISGVYRNVETGAPLRVAQENDQLRVVDGPALRPMSGRSFTATSITASTMRLEFAKSGKLSITTPTGPVETYERTTIIAPTAAELGALTGTYVSDEAMTTFEAVIEGASLVLKRAPDSIMKLTPAYKDAFMASELGGVIFRRDVSGKVVGLSITQDRVWDLRFRRL